MLSVQVAVWFCLLVAHASCQAAVTIEGSESAYLVVNTSKIVLYDEELQAMNVSFVLQSTSNSPLNVDAALISAAIYSESTAFVVGERFYRVPLFICQNTSLCGSIHLRLQPVRYGRATLPLGFQFLKSQPSCATTEIDELQDSDCIVGSAQKLVTIAVIHNRDVFDKIFRYSTIVFVVFLTFLMGTQLNIDEVIRILRRPLAPCVGVACQYIGMPLLAIGVCQLFFVIPSPHSASVFAVNSTLKMSPFEPSESTVSQVNYASETMRNAMLAFGLLALGCAPGGGASNTWTVLLHGDLQLSMSLTFFSTLLSFGMMPLWLFGLTPLLLRHLPRDSVDKLLLVASTNSSSSLTLNVTSESNVTGVDTVSAEHQLQVPYVHIVYQLFSFVVPCVCGVLLRKFRPKLAERFRIPLKCTSGFFVLFMVTYGMWVHRYVFRVVIDDPRLFALTAALPFFGYSLGYAVAYAALRDRPQAVAVAVETGIQNMSIAILIVKYNLPSPASDLGTVVLILVALIGPLPLYLIFTVLLMKKRCAEHRSMRRESVLARDGLRIELETAKLTDHDLDQLEKEGKLAALDGTGKFPAYEKQDLNGKLMEASTITTLTEDV